MSDIPYLTILASGAVGAGTGYYFRDAIGRGVQRVRGLRGREALFGETQHEAAARRLGEIAQGLGREDLSLEFLMLATDVMVSSLQHLPQDQEVRGRQLVHDIRLRLEDYYRTEAIDGLERVPRGSLYTDTQIRELSELARRLDEHYRRYGFDQRDIPPAPQPQRPNRPAR